MKTNKIFAAGILSLMLAAALMLSACGADPKESAQETHTSDGIYYPTSSSEQEKTAADPGETTAAGAESSAAVTESAAPATAAPTEPATEPTPDVPPVTQPDVPPTTEVPPETKPADQIIRYDDGSQIVRRFDEAGRQIEESFYYADGQLNYSDRKEFYPDGSVKRESYEERFRDGSGKIQEWEFFENGDTKTARYQEVDGSAAVYEYDEAGHLIAEDTYYPNGQQERQKHWAYSADGEYLERHFRTWAEDGRLTYRDDTTFHANGTAKTSDITYENGTRQVQEFRDDGQVLLEEEYRAGGQKSHQANKTYDENGACLESRYEEWQEDGSLNRSWDITYRPDGTKKTAREIYSWQRDTECYSEFDEQEREVLYEEKALDGSSFYRSEREYFPDSEQYSKRTVTEQTESGTTKRIELFWENGTVRESTQISADGSSHAAWYNEEGYDIRLEIHDATGFLTRLEETEYFENSTTTRRAYWKNWEEDLNEYSWSEEIYDENRVRRQASGSNYNGSTYYCEYSEHGDVTVMDCRYPNGQPESYSEYRYDDETGQRIFEGERYWDEDGSNERYYEDSYYPDGTRKESRRQEDDKETVETYNKQGYTVLREEYTKDALTARVEYVYAADGTTRTEYHRKAFAEDGSLFTWADEYYYADGSLRKKSYGSVEGWEQTYEYREDGTLKLEIDVNMEGIKTYEYVLSDDGSYTIREWHDNGQPAVYRSVDAGGSHSIYEEYLDNGILYIRNEDGPDGFIHYRTYDAGTGQLRFESLVKDGIYHDRYYVEGRLIVDRRYHALEGGGYDTYLGNTVWEYFTDGGVKKIRISESDASGTTISQKVVDDDGKIGYPED
ncbi:MAG: hypothetical protein J5496_08300 [Lachnospiraceae bacterium]|nr:hypothetical protein [Lachnospiraceae bacterium]